MLATFNPLIVELKNKYHSMEIHTNTVNTYIIRVRRLSIVDHSWLGVDKVVGTDWNVASKNKINTTKYLSSVLLLLLFVRVKCGGW